MPEHPWCYDEETGRWKNNSKPALDYYDLKNSPDGGRVIDWHDCVSLRVDGDSLPDIACVVGADKGTGT